MKAIISSLCLATAALLLTSCGSVGSSTTNLSGDRVKTATVDIGRPDVKLIYGSAQGISKGFKLLGFITFKDAKEGEAVRNMYQDARNAGAPPEGAARTFCNTAIHTSSNYYILFSIPEVTCTGDLVEFTGSAQN